MQPFVRHQGLRYLLVIISLLCFANSVRATTVIVPADDDMIVGARAIVRAKVLSIASSLDQQQDRIFTYITLRVQEVLKGEITERRIVLKELGGTVGDRSDIIFGNPQYRVGEKVIAYLDTWADGSLRTHQLFLGKFNIVRDAASGKEFAVRSSPDENTEVLQSQLHAEHAYGHSTERMLLEDYTRMVRERLAANWDRSVSFENQYYRDVPVLAEPYEFDSLSSRHALQPQFTLLGAFRFFEPDDGLPVICRVNPTGAPSAQTVSDMAAVMAAWSNVAGCSLQITQGSNLTQCYSAESFNGIGMVFDNCDGRHSASGGCQSVLAIGGISNTGFRTRVIDGTTFRQTTKGFVSFNPFASCHFAERCNVQEIATHEIGHALGLGHSQDGSATMAAFAHFDGRCASIKTDDENGIRFIYPGSGGGGGGTPVSITTSSLPNGTVGASYSQTLVASGGTSPYTWSLASGSGPLPAGLTLTSNGTITGTPTTAGTSTFTVRAADSASGSAQKSLSITVNPSGSSYNSQFLSQNVPTTVTPGQAFQSTLSWRNTGTQTWNGSGGFRLGSQNPTDNSIWGGNAVIISGITVAPNTDLNVTFTAFAPTTPGTYNFQWRTYQDGVGYFGEASDNVVITVGQAPSNPAIEGPNSFNATAGAQFSNQFSATGGTTPYSWSVVSGALPGGLTLNSATGLLSGPLNTAGSFSFTLQVTDSGQRTGQKAITFNVAPAPTNPTISGPGTFDVVLGGQVSQLFTATGGSAPYTWSVTSGTLPGGITLNATTGVLGGTANALGSFSFTIQARDTAQRTGQKSITFNVAPPPPEITQSSLPEATMGISYSQALSATGGTQPYSWSVKSGVLPPGLNLFAGVISGIPLTSGNYSFTLQVADSGQRTGQKALSINVKQPGSISVQPDASVETLKGSSFSYQPTASGGVGPYNWSITAGTFPAGLSLNSTTGAITGTPTVSGTFNVEITVRDQASQTAKTNLQIKVVDPATVPLITKIKYKRNKKTVIIGQRFNRDAVLIMDGVQTSARVNVDRFVIKKLTLTPGQHQFRVVNPNGNTSPVFVLTIN